MKMLYVFVSQLCTEPQYSCDIKAVLLSNQQGCVSGPWMSLKREAVTSATLAG